MSIIKELQRIYKFDPDRELLWAGYQSAIENLASQLNPSNFHFLYEIIQNADDNTYTNTEPKLNLLIKELEIENSKQICLVIINNEVGFNEDNVKAICSTGLSTKAKELDSIGEKLSIGEKGIGFKSVFRITECPYIFSNEYSFKLPEEPIEKKGIGYIYPIDVTDERKSIENQLNTKDKTIIILPFKSSRISNEIINELFKLNDYSILFLRKLRQLSIEVDIPTKESSRIINRIDENCFRSLEVILKKKKTVRKFYIFKKKILKPKNINHEKRPGATDRNIEIAFPIDHELENGVLFSYLPVYENIELPFFINADFLLTSSREDILQDLDWNKWLRDAIAETYVKGLIEVLISTDFSIKTKVNFYKTIPSKTVSKKILEPVTTAIHNLLKNTAFILPYDYSNQKPEELYIIEDVKKASFQLTQVLNTSKKLPSSIIEREIVFLNDLIFDKEITDILTSLGLENLLLQELRDHLLMDNSWMLENDENWLIELFKYLKNKNFETLKIDAVPIIPLEEKEGLYSSQNENIYFEIESKENFVGTLKKFANEVSFYQIKKSFLNKLNNNDIQKKWLTDTLNIHDFNEKNLAIDCLEVLKQYHQKDFDTKDIISLTKITFSLFSDFEKNTFIGLPVVLESDEIVNLKDRKGNLVVHEKYDEKTGWQHIFNEQERNHFQVLSKKYTNPILEKFINLGLINQYPDFGIKIYSEQEDYNEIPVEQNIRTLYVKSRSWNNNRNLAKVEYYNLPEFFRKSKFNKQEAQLIASYCTDRIKNASKEYLSFDFYLFRHKYYINNQGSISRDYFNDFYTILKNKEWVLLENDEIKKPKEIFLKIPQELKKLEGYIDCSKYLDKSLNDLLLYLGATERIDFKSLSRIIVSVLVYKDVSQEAMIEIYNFIEKERKNNPSYSQTVPENVSQPIIFVPNKDGKCWFAPSDCVWESETGEDENTKQLNLSSVYPVSLKALFLHLGVAEKHDVQFYFNQWKSLVDEQDSDTFKWDNVLRNIKSNNESWDDILDCLDEYLGEDFKEEEIIFCENKGGFYSIENAVYPDDTHLRTVFSEVLPFAYFPKKEGFTKWRGFFKDLNINTLTENVTKELKQNLSEFKLLNEKKILTKSTIILIAAYLKTNFEVYYTNAINNKLFENLIYSDEYESEKEFFIKYEYDDNNQYEFIETKKDIFIDSSFSHLVFQQNIENDDIAREIYFVLNQTFELPKEFESKLENYLGVKDYEKRMEKEGLSSPDEVIAQFSKGSVAEPIPPTEPISPFGIKKGIQTGVTQEGKPIIPPIIDPPIIVQPISPTEPEIRVRPTRNPREGSTYNPDENLGAKKTANENEGKRIANIESCLSNLKQQNELTLGWLKYLILLEKYYSSQDNQQNKFYNFTFYNAQRDSKKDNIVILSESNGVIQNYIENFENFELNFYTSSTIINTSSTIIKLKIQSLSVNNSIVRARLQNPSDYSIIESEQIEKVVLRVEKTDFLWEHLYQNIDNHKEYSSGLELLKIAKQKNNLSFIYGPPGTGKTTSIVERIQSPKNLKKTLILTPTNKSADVIAERLIENNCRRKFYRHGNTNSDIIEEHLCYIGKTLSTEKGINGSIFITTIHRYSYDSIQFEKEQTSNKIREIVWDEIIVDEASMINLAQITDLLMSTANNSEIVVAGDPHQIRPILKMENWKNMNIYSLVGLSSFNVQFPKNTKHKVKSLTTQYRSVPSIGKIFSEFSYESKLNHHRDNLGKPKYHLFGEKQLKSLNVINFPISENGIYKIQKVENSPFQIYLSLLFVEWFQYFIKQFSDQPKKIGIICPYRTQTDVVYKLMNGINNEKNEHEIMINTVHGFQGDECDIIICLFNPSTGVSVNLNDKNVLNVAISRAKDYLILFVPENIENVNKLSDLMRIIDNSSVFSKSETTTEDIENCLFNDKKYIETNSFSTASQNINVFGKSNFKYEIRTSVDSVAIQINNPNEPKN